MKASLIGTLALLICSVAPAAPTRMPRTCVVANQVCFILRAPAAGFTPEQRITKVNERLAYILGNEPCRPATITAVAVGSDVEINVGRSSLVTVTGKDATASGFTTASGLAATWLARLQKAMPAGRCR